MTDAISHVHHVRPSFNISFHDSRTRYLAGTFRPLLLLNYHHYRPAHANTMPTLNLTVCIGRNTINYRISSTARGQRLTTALGKHLGLSDPDALRIVNGDSRLQPDETLEEQGIEDGDELYCFFQLAGGFIGDGLYIKSPADIPQLSMEMVLTAGLSARHVSLPGALPSRDTSNVVAWSGSAKSGHQGSGYLSSVLQERESGYQQDGLAWNIRFVISLFTLALYSL